MAPLINSTTYSNTEIPVIDFADVSEPGKRASVMKQITYAFENYGFFEAINSCVSVQRLDDVFDASKAFFEQPPEKKREDFPERHVENPNSEAGNLFFTTGWVSGIVFNGVDCHKENIGFYHFPQSSDSPDTVSNGDSNHATLPSEVQEKMTPPDPYPASAPNYRKKVDTLTESLGEFADQLLDLISESLGLPPTFIRKQYHDNSLPRHILLHYYPKSTKPESDDENGIQIGLAGHTDATIITLVAEGFGTSGLQINLTGDRWITAMPSRGGLIINAGDVLQVWSNGRYKSLIHRAINNKNRDRYSFAYIMMPIDRMKSELQIKPIPQLVSADSPPRYKPFAMHHYFQKRAETNSVNVLAESFASGL